MSFNRFYAIFRHFKLYRKNEKLQILDFEHITLSEKSIPTNNTIISFLYMQCYKLKTSISKSYF